MSDPLLEAREAFARGDDARALALALPLAATPPVRDDVLLLIANAALRHGRFDDGIAALAALRQRHPGQPALARGLATALNNRGSARERAGAQDEAEADYRAALSHEAEHPPALYNLGRLRLAAGDADEAARLFARALQRAPDDAELALWLGEAELSIAPTAAAARLAALAQRAAPPEPARLARLCARAGLAPEVAALLARHAGSESLEPWFAAPETLAWNGETATARDAYARLAAIGDDGRRSPALRAVLASHLTLPPVPEDVAALTQARAGYTQGLAALVDRFGADRLARCAPDLAQLAWSNFLLAYQGGDDRALQARYGDWLALAARTLAPDLARAPDRTPGPVPHVVFVSAFFRESTVGAYFGAWPGLLAARGCHVTVVQLGPRRDAFTDALAAGGVAVQVLDGPLEAVARTVRALRADLVIHPELGMDARGLVLAALRLAPRQAAAWGHPVTPGLPTLDGLFTCAAMEPPDAAAHYREPLLPLPGLGAHWRRPPLPPAATRDQLGLPPGPLVLVPQSAFKLHPEGDAVLAAVAAAEPALRLVLFDNEYPGMTRRLCARLGQALATAGADPVRQLLVLPMTGRARFLAIARACNVMLDPLHWSGGNTALDAFHVGLPVVSCPGRFLRGRQSAAMAARMGLADELVVARAEDLAPRTLAIAGDATLRARLSAAIRDGQSALHADEGLGDALRDAVDRLLAGPPGDTEASRAP